MIINLLLGLAVIVVGAGLWFIAMSSEWGERFVAILTLLGLAYCVGGILRLAL